MGLSCSNRYISSGTQLYQQGITLPVVAVGSGMSYDISEDDGYMGVLRSTLGAMVVTVGTDNMGMYLMCGYRTNSANLTITSNVAIVDVANMQDRDMTTVGTVTFVLANDYLRFARTTSAKTGWLMEFRRTAGAGTFKIQTSDNAIDWTDLTTTINSGSSLMLLEEITARYVQILCVDPGIGTTITVYEVHSLDHYAIQLTSEDYRPFSFAMPNISNQLNVIAYGCSDASVGGGAVGYGDAFSCRGISPINLGASYTVKVV